MGDSLTNALIRYYSQWWSFTVCIGKYLAINVYVFLQLCVDARPHFAHGEIFESHTHFAGRPRLLLIADRHSSRSIHLSKGSQTVRITEVPLRDER